MAGFVHNIFKSITSPQAEDEYDYDYDDMEEISSVSDYDDREEEQVMRDKTSDVGVETRENKVVNIHATTQLQVVLFKPTNFGEETRAVADELLRMHTVVLNLEKTEKNVSRRILDFLSGVAYANNGKIKRVASDTFIITPYNVDLMGDDLMDELESNGLYV